MSCHASGTDIVDEPVHLARSHVVTKARVEDHVGAAAFVGVGHLFGDYGGEFRFCHARSSSNARLLHVFRRRDEQHRVDFTLTANFKQKRNVEDDEIGTRGTGLGSKFGAPGAHEWWTIASSRANAAGSLTT